MRLKLLPFFIILLLSVIQISASSKMDVKIEAGMYLPASGGKILNTESSSDFETDFGYMDLQASYFSLIFLVDYDYAPNINVSYFNMKDSQDSNLDRTIKVADGGFNSFIYTTLDYNVLSVILYQDFMKKGKYLSFFGKKYYSGDFEFDLGVNTRIINWKFNIQDALLRGRPSWITVDEYVPLPYLGFKYYLYDLIVNTEISALAISKVKSRSYKIDFDYHVLKNVYLSAGYLYEQFKAVEKLDTVEFETTGYKFGFKYIF